MWALALIAACRNTDPDALLRARDLDGAAAAYEKAHGAPLDVDHPVAQILATRALRDPDVTTATIADAMEVVRLLEAAPRIGNRSVDHPFDRWQDLFAAAGGIAEPPLLVAVGRSETAADRDPWTTDAPLPWREGRVVGWARKRAGEGNDALVALGKRLDDDPPAKLVTVVVKDARGQVALYASRETDGWWIRWSNEPDSAVALIRAMEAARPSPG